MGELSRSSVALSFFLLLMVSCGGGGSKGPNGTDVDLLDGADLSYRGDVTSDVLDLDEVGPMDSFDDLPPWQVPDLTSQDVFNPLPVNLCDEVTCLESCVYYVSVEGDSSNDGLSPTSPLSAVQPAIEAAAITAGPCCECDVQVAQGTYFVYSEGPWETIQLREGVNLLGGFTADFSGPPDPVANETILDGGESTGEFTLRVKHVVTGADRSLLEGFVVTHGECLGDPGAFGPWSSAQMGAGMLNVGVSPDVRNCVFRANQGMMGGALVFVNSQSEVSQCRFEANQAYFGAGIVSNHSQLHLHDCLFLDNEADVGGAAMAIFGMSEIVVTSSTEEACRFEGNAGGETGGAVFISEAIMEVRGCGFMGNSAGEEGGAIASKRSDITLSEVSFVGNVITGSCDYQGSCQGIGGGGIVLVDSTLSLDGVSFTGNRASECEGAGDFVPPNSTGQCTGYGGAISASGESLVIASDSSFEGNLAHWGGAVAATYGASISLEGCVLSQNQAADYDPWSESGQGGAIHLDHSNLEMVASVCEENQSSVGACIHGLDSPVTARQSKIRENSAVEGGGISLMAWDQPSPVDIEGCLFSSNYASALGGAVSLSPGAEPVNIVNCTFFGNVSDGDGGALALFVGDIAPVIVANSIFWDNSNPAIEEFSSYISHQFEACDIQATIAAGSNLSQYPKFVDPPEDLHLNADSPCVNKGVEGYVTLGVDLDGNPRTVDGAVDIGAYENQEVQ